MRKFFKFLLLVLVLIPIVILIANKNHNKIIAFEANGVITEIEWKSRNHEMPIITIKEGRKTYFFQSYRITLTPNDIKVGDKFVKTAHSKLCMINELEIVCLN